MLVTIIIIIIIIINKDHLDLIFLREAVIHKMRAHSSLSHSMAACDFLAKNSACCAFTDFVLGFVCLFASTILLAVVYVQGSATQALSFTNMLFI